MIQHNQIASIKKAEQAKDIVSMLNTDFPDVIRGCWFFEKFARNDINILYQIKNKEHFLNLFIGERFEVILQRTFSILMAIEDYFSLGKALAHMRTHCKR